MTKISKAAFAKADELYERERPRDKSPNPIYVYQRALARVLDEHSEVAKRVLDGPECHAPYPLITTNLRPLLEALILPGEPDRLAAAWQAAHNDCGAFVDQLRKHGGRIVWDDEG